MRKLFSIFILCILCACCAVGFAACEKEISSNDNGGNENIIHEAPVHIHIYENGVCTGCGALEPTSDEYFKFIYLEETDSYSINVKDKNNLPENIVLPSEYDGKKITHIGYDIAEITTEEELLYWGLDENNLTDSNYAFMLCKNIQTIIIPDSVTSIGDGAFYECSNLTSIDIPDSVTSIGKGVFEYCSLLTTETIGNSVKAIGDSTFYKCSNLTSINIPDNVTIIDLWTFGYCSSLTSVKFGKNSQLTSIGRDSFCMCSGLTSITIPDNVTSIGLHAFAGCSSLTSVYYNGTVEDWSKILIDSGNTDLTNATLYYYSEREPIEDGNYWHYDSDSITPIIWVKEN